MTVFQSPTEFRLDLLRHVLGELNRSGPPQSVLVRFVSMELAMSFLNGKRRKGKRGKPTESARVNENIVLDLWIDDSDTYYWCLSRVNPRDESESFRTLRPSDSLDAVEGIAFFLSVMTKAPGFSESDQTVMQKLAHALEKVVGEFRQAKSDPVLSNGETKSILVSPVR